MKLPEHETKTLNELKKRITEHHNSNQNFNYFTEPLKIINHERYYLGMSGVGHECERKIFYDFRNVSTNDFGINGVLATQDGHIQEQLFIDRIRFFMPEIELITEQRGGQIAVSDCGGHFSGHLDGVICGIFEAPKTWHVWEHKAVNETKFNKLKTLAANEKTALKEWDIIYYAQAQVYMHYTDLSRHFLTVSTPGGRDYYSIRTDYNKKDALYYIERAKSIIENNDIPVKLSDKPEYFKCKWCNHQQVCHFNAVPALNCKTCNKLQYQDNTIFYCTEHKKNIEPAELKNACDNHIYIPDLINLPVLKKDDLFTIYKLDGEKTLVNCSKENAAMKNDDKNIYLVDSDTLRNKIKNLNNLVVEPIRAAFKGEVIEKKDQ